MNSTRSHTLKHRIRMAYAAMMGLDEALPTNIMPEAFAFAKLDYFGTGVILEHIASGRTRTEIAAAFEVPQIAFHKWLAKRVKHEDLKVAMSCCADALVTRAMYALTTNHGSSDEQRAMKEYSKQLREMAACMEPETWMASKVGGGAAGAAPVSVTIVPASSAPSMGHTATGYPAPLPTVPPGAVPLNVINHQPGAGSFGVPKTAANIGR